MTARQDVARKPFSEVLDTYLEIQFFARWYKANARYDAVKFNDIEREAAAAREELDDYLNEKE